MVIIHKKHVETEEEKAARVKDEQEKARGIQDQYQARGFELVSWVQDNKIAVSLVIALLIVGGGTYSGYLFYQQRASENASAVYLDATKKIEGVPQTGDENVAKWKQAEADLSQLATSAGSSGIGVIASLYAGHLALENNDAKKSIEHYQTGLKGLRESDALYSLALIGLAYAQEKNNEADAALGSLEKVIESKSTAGKDLVLWEASRIASEKDKEKAKKYLTRLLDEYPSSVYEKNARRLKDSLL